MFLSIYTEQDADILRNNEQLLLALFITIEYNLIISFQLLDGHRGKR